MVEILGVVSLVGAGPGDPGLITVKGLQRLREADVVAYDRLVDSRLLEEVREDAELIDVGKQAGQGGSRQRSIYPILIDRAHEGKRVVRLKGGDPFVFGRGGEEAQVLAMAGIPFEVVPGVSSAVAAPAYAGIPLTHRDAATSFTVVSAVEDAEKRESAIPWGVLARTRGTLVVMMGWGALPRVVDRLLEEGMPPSMPVAVVQWGTEPYQKTVVGNLGNIVERARDADFGPPVVVVIGRVVELRREIRWYRGQTPLWQACAGDTFQDPGVRAEPDAHGGRCGSHRGTDHRNCAACGLCGAGRSPEVTFGASGGWSSPASTGWMRSSAG